MFFPKKKKNIFHKNPDLSLINSFNILNNHPSHPSYFAMPAGDFSPVFPKPRHRRRSGGCRVSAQPAPPATPWRWCRCWHPASWATSCGPVGGVRPLGASPTVRWAYGTWVFLSYSWPQKKPFDVQKPFIVRFFSGFFFRFVSGFFQVCLEVWPTKKCGFKTKPTRPSMEKEVTQQRDFFCCFPFVTSRANGSRWVDSRGFCYRRNPCFGVRQMGLFRSNFSKNKSGMVWKKNGGGMSNEPTGDVALVNGESHAKIANPMGQNVQQFLAMNHPILQGQSLLACPSQTTFYWWVCHLIIWRWV